VRIVVTGGAGFIGGRVVDLLAGAGHDVVVLDSLDRSVHPVPPAVPPGTVVGDVADPAAWRQAADGAEVVCHLAARVGLGRDPSDVVDYVRDNDLGTAVGLRELHRTGFAGRIVLASSMVVYGEGRGRCPVHGLVRPAARRVEDVRAGRYEPRCPACGRETTWIAVTEDEPLWPASVYAATKLHQEHLTAAFGRATGVAVTALRYHNVYGPAMPRDTPYAGVAAIFRSEIEAGRPPRVLEDGGQTRDFVHVDDVARATVAAATSDRPVDGPLNVASGRPCTVLEMARRLCDGTGLEPEVVGGTRSGDVRHVVASAERAAERLGFRAAVGWEEGIRAFREDPLRPTGGAP
jgi:dTDP-L-rhamnose 4-epimerase